MNQPDFIVVGAGSAGCIIARRLARDFGATVTLVETNSEPAPAMNRNRPARWLRLLKSSDDWNFTTGQIEKLANRSLHWPRGRGIGGSSRINAMIWFPPTRGDLLKLTQATNGQWTPTRITEAFDSIEALLQPEKAHWLSSASKTFLQAVEKEKNATPMAYDRLQHHGRRRSLETLLHDTDNGVRSWHSRIEITRGNVDRIAWRNQRASGVTLMKGDGETTLTSKKGVILTAGTIGTPCILMRSGIGDKESLEKLGIHSQVSRPAVGQQLHDHLIMPVIFRLKQIKERFSDEFNPRSLVRWQTLGTGPLCSNLAECGGLFMEEKIQLHVTPTHYLSFPKIDNAAWMSIGVNATQPKSQGEVRITSANPLDAPEIKPNYLCNHNDLVETLQGVQFVRDLTKQKEIEALIDSEVLPGSRRDSENSIQRAIERYAQTLYHPLGTCGVGTSDDAVVDPMFQVRGTSGVWVADGSVFPGITVGNPNAMIMSLAWIAAEEIMGTSGLS